MGHESDINRQKTLLAIAKFGKQLRVIDSSTGQLQHLMFQGVPGLPPGGMLDHVVFLRNAFDVLRSGLLFVAKQQGLSPEDLARAYEDDVAAAKASAQASAQAVSTEQEQRAAVVEEDASEEKVDFDKLRELAYGTRSDVDHPESLPPVADTPAS